MDVRLRAEAQSNHMEGGRSLQSVKMVCNSMYGIHNRIGCQRSRRFFFHALSSMCLVFLEAAVMLFCWIG